MRDTGREMSEEDGGRASSDCGVQKPRRRNSDPMANLVFSAVAGAVSLAVAVLSAAKGAWAVTAVFGALAIGFALRAAERFWSGRR